MQAPDPALAADLALIEASAREAGEIAKAYFGGSFKRWDKGQGQPVTEADLAVNAHLEQHLRGARPDYGWLSEESADDTARLSAAATFVVDPIDGTVAFMKGRPHFAICIAVVRNGRPACGVVYNPIADECFLAGMGTGATMNGNPIVVSTQDQIAGCRMLAGKAIFEHPFWSTAPQTPWPAMQLQTFSSIAYRIALVAEGRFDAALALSAKKDWDVAAADVVLSEAGGRISDHRGRTLHYNTAAAEIPSLVCAGPPLHAALIEKLAPVVLPRPSR